MTTKKYLDYEGVKYLWSKINGKVDEVNNFEYSSITVIDTTGAGVSTTVKIKINSKTTSYTYTPVVLL